MTADSISGNLKAILESPTYRLAEDDSDLLKRPELRPVRMQLEVLKPELTLAAEGISSTIVVFGGTQIVDQPEAVERVTRAEQALGESPQDPHRLRELARARRIAAKADFYRQAREFARLVSCQPVPGAAREYVIVTGGGPGIMEAGNRGACDAGAKSIGFNIQLPAEQAPNPYITPELCFQFHYFAMRKLHFVMRAKALVTFPGGFGTLDELFEVLTLRQTGRMRPIPVLMFGTDYWRQVINFQFLADEGVIADEHLELFTFVDDPRQAWETILRFHGKSPHVAPA